MMPAVRSTARLPSDDQRLAAVDHERGAVDVGRALGDQEAHGVGNVLARAQSARRDGLDELAEDGVRLRPLGARGSLLDEALTSGEAAQVGQNRHDLHPSGVHDRYRCLLQLRCGAGTNGDVHALFSQFARDRPANAFACTRHERGLALESQIHRLFSLPGREQSARTELCQLAEHSSHTLRIMA